MASAVETETPLPTGEPKVEANGTQQPTQLSSSASSVHSAGSTTKDVNEETAASSQTTTEQPVDDWRPASWTSGPLKTPIPRPVARAKATILPELSSEQKMKYKIVHDVVSEWKSIPSTTARNAPQVPIQELERMWLSRENILRYLRASKWVTKTAIMRLQSTLSWRREYGADKFTHAYISPENETGKQTQLGYDNERRPVLYLNPAKQNTKMSDRQIQHLCYMLDRTLDLLPSGQEKVCLLINFKGAASGNIPTLGQAKAVLNILQNHNPERLGRALISECPWYVATFFKVISPFIDPVTKEKIKFNEDFRQYIPPEQLWDHHGGDLNFEYNHEAYWPAFDTICSERRAAVRERWEKAGSKVGEYEEYLRGGDHVCLADEESAKGADAASEGVATLTI